MCGYGYVYDYDYDYGYESYFMTGLRGTSSQAPCPGLGPAEERTPLSRMSHVAVHVYSTSARG